MIPTVVIAETTRGNPRDASVNRALRILGNWLPLTEPVARNTGFVLQRSGHGANPELVIDAAVVAHAMDYRPSSILTSDWEDMQALVGTDRDIRIFTVNRSPRRGNI